MRAVTQPANLTEWLSHCERLHPKTIDMTLDRVKAVKDKLGIAFGCPTVVVAGTNGKGSTCAMLEAIALHAGYRVGLYIKPHLVHFQERCRVGGEPVKGYREEPGVSPDSTTETFVALRAEIANWRWAGVPFYIRTGKRLAARDAHIVVNFRPAPHAIFGAPAGAANRLVINLQPKDGLELHLMAQGQDNRKAARSAVHHLTPVQLDLDFDKRFGSERVGAYERLLLDVIDGRLNLFVRSDEQEEAWRWVEPLLNHWRGNPTGLRPYAAGTWGPSASSAMIARDGYCWSEER